MGFSLSGEMWLPIRSGWGHINFLNVTFKVVDCIRGFIKWFKNKKQVTWHGLKVRWEAELLLQIHLIKKRERMRSQRANSLTLQLFETALQDVGILHLVYKGSWREIWLMFARIKIHVSALSLEHSVAFTVNRPSNPDFQLSTKTNWSLHKSKARSHGHGM